MNDEDFINSLSKELQGSGRESTIRMIADAIVEFLEYFNIDLNQMERERLSLYLVHYHDSRKAAAHIIPIKESIKIIPNCINKIANIIDETSALILENEILDQNKKYNDLFTNTFDEKPVIEDTTIDDTENRRKKLSNIHEFLENST
jgi:hypothetical protein